jgi:hypothetical protein
MGVKSRITHVIKVKAIEEGMGQLKMGIDH